MEETEEFLRMVESTGIAAVAIHGRYREERPRHPNHDDLIKRLTSVVSIPVIAK